jgi:hypothetical protein
MTSPIVPDALLTQPGDGRLPGVLGALAISTAIGVLVASVIIVPAFFPISTVGSLTPTDPLLTRVGEWAAVYLAPGIVATIALATAAGARGGRGRRRGIIAGTMIAFSLPLFLAVQFVDSVFFARGS